MTNTEEPAADVTGTETEPSEEEMTAAGLNADGTPITVDVVQMASLGKDGTPDQTDGYKFLDPAAGAELLALQEESRTTGRDMVRERGADAVRAARAARDDEGGGAGGRRGGRRGRR
jgi:hypothetical protein